MIPIRDTIRSHSFPIVNWLIIAANAVVFFIELSLSPAGLNRLIGTFGLVPANVHLQNPLTLVPFFTNIFLHGGWLHILSNMWVLFIFGDNIEDRMGHIRYLIFYLLSGVAAGLLESYVLPASNVPMIGASGAIAGVLGAYLILFPQARIASIVPIIFIFTIIEIPAVIFLLFWFILQLFSGWTALAGAAGSSGVAWWAHVGGFLFGMLAVRFFAQRRPLYYQP